MVRLWRRSVPEARRAVRSSDPKSGVSVLARLPVRDGVAVARAVRQPDAPRGDRVHFASLLYSLHFLLILFWLYDHSPQQRATGDLLDFVRDSLGLLRPMLVIPMVSSSLARLAEIMAAVFVGEG
jgi:hypothetical protein